MRFDGIEFRKNNKIVVLPANDAQGNPMPYVKDGKTNYLAFGRVVPEGKEPPKKAVKTGYTFTGSGNPVYAVPVELNGHSLTNMAYGKTGRVYLCKDGVCYTAPAKRV